MTSLSAPTDSELIIPKPVRPVLFYLLIPALPVSRKTPSRLVGALNHSERQLKIAKYRHKKMNRLNMKKIRYKCRQEQACKRERVKGKFIKAESPSRKMTADEDVLEDLYTRSVQPDTV